MSIILPPVKYFLRTIVNIGAWQKKLFEDMDKFIAATEKDFILAL